MDLHKYESSDNSSSNSKSKPKVFPSPQQLFSLIPKAIVPPEEPMPAPALISPVDCSSTFISIILRLLADPSLILYLTSLNNLLALISAIDFSS